MKIIATAYCVNCREKVGTASGETPAEDPQTVARARKALADDLRQQIAREGHHLGHSITIKVEGAGEDESN